MVELATRILIACALAAPLTAQTSPKPPASPDSLATITARGRALARYDYAAWHASDAVQALPLKLTARDSSLTWGYIVHLDGNAADVDFGGLTASRDTFLVRATAHDSVLGKPFTAREFMPGRPDTGYDAAAARALLTARTDFGGRDRPYNEAVLPTDHHTWWVYRYPASTTTGVWPFGADARYEISSDGRTILAKRQLHRTIIETDPGRQAQKPVASYHIAVLDDVPEDTDVLLVLQRRPPLIEYVATPAGLVYRINLDGSIVFGGYVDPPHPP